MRLLKLCALTHAMPSAPVSRQIGASCGFVQGEILKFNEMQLRQQLKQAEEEVATIRHKAAEIVRKAEDDHLASEAARQQEQERAQRAEALAKELAVRLVGWR